jgi:hypothetical protein
VVADAGMKLSSQPYEALDEDMQKLALFAQEFVHLCFA